MAGTCRNTLVLAETNIHSEKTFREMACSFEDFIVNNCSFKYPNVLINNRAGPLCQGLCIKVFDQLPSNYRKEKSPHQFQYDLGG